MPAWARYGIVAGIVAFAATLAADLSVLWLRPADLCRAGPPILLLMNLVALLVFLVLAASAGFVTGRTTGVVSEAVLAGLLVGAISGCALVATTPFISRATQRLQDLSAACPQTREFTRSFFSASRRRLEGCRVRPLDFSVRHRRPGFPSHHPGAFQHRHPRR